MLNTPCQASLDEMNYDVPNRGFSQEDELDVDAFLEDAKNLLGSRDFENMAAEGILERGLSDRGTHAYRTLIDFLNTIDDVLSDSASTRFAIKSLSDAYREAQDKFNAPNAYNDPASFADYEGDLMASLLYDNQGSSAFVRQCVTSYANGEVIDNDKIQDVIRVVGELVLGRHPENNTESIKSISPKV